VALVDDVRTAVEPAARRPLTRLGAARRQLAKLVGYTVRRNQQGTAQEVTLKRCPRFRGISEGYAIAETAHDATLWLLDPDFSDKIVVTWRSAGGIC
jgi:hypothetical protein